MNKYFTIICLFVLTGWSVQANAVAYTITDLGSFRGESINDSGQIAGMVMLDGVRRAAVRKTDGTMLHYPSTNDSDSWAYDISNTGYVAVMCGPEAYRWDGVNTPQRLDGPGLKDAPHAINDQGIIVGWSADLDYNQRAVIWDVDGTMKQVPGVSGDGEAYDINNSGQVLGRDSHGRSFLWCESGGLDYLDFFGNAINSAGWIAGTEYYTNPGSNVGHSRAVFLRPGGDLEVLRCLPEWGDYTGSYINDVGQIVGEALFSDGYHVILWNPDGSILDLGAGQPFALNDRGVVIGWWNDTSNGSTHSILWQPVPELSSILSLLFGLGGVLLKTRRR